MIPSTLNREGILMKLVDEKIIAEMLAKSVQTLRNDRFLGRGLPYARIGRSIRYDIDDVTKFIESRKIETKDSIEAGK
jgi:hypothetical protein